MHTQMRARICLYIGITASVSGMSSVSLAQGGSAMHTVGTSGDAIDHVGDAELRRALQRFVKLREKRQRDVLEAVRGAVAKLDDPYLRSLERLAERGGVAGKQRHKALRVSKRYRRSETAKKTARSLLDELPFRSRVGYRWGFGDIAERHGAGSSRRVSKSRRRRATTKATLEDLCAGYPLDIDRALAGLLRDMDNERCADVHAVFLECWRNGAETFYQALARTAGTKEGVFCYDAMLTEWVNRCVGRRHPEYPALAKSIHAAQQAFYRMAATYRRYRGMREMVALSLLLPAGHRLPERLARLYEDNGGSGTSARDNVVLMLAGHGGDVQATVAAILESTDRMPADPWHGDYDPMSGVYAKVKRMIPQLTAGGGHTDQILAAEQKKRQQLQVRIAQAARRALLQSLAK